jgi:DNA-binding SARP family transcriptional activator
MDAIDNGDLERAVSKYDGAFLQGLHIPEAPEFVRWIETSRDRLARLYAIGIEHLADEETQRGDTLAAAERWRRLWEMDPYNSRIVTRTMEALNAAGARCEALRLAERHEELIAQTFDADLEPEVRVLAERLRKPTR